MDNLEQQLISSRKIREFLKHFSQTQWSRVIKASVIMGIQELERSNKIQNLSCQDLEDIVVSNEASLRSEQPSVTNESHQNTAKDPISVPKVELQAQNQLISQNQFGRDRTNSLPNFSQQAPHQQVLRRGGRPTQGSNHQPQDSARIEQRPVVAVQGGESTAFSKPHFIQGLTATVTSRQKGGVNKVGTTTTATVDDTTINDSIAEDLATFGDQQFYHNVVTVPVLPVNQPQRARSVPRNIEKLAFQQMQQQQQQQQLQQPQSSIVPPTAPPQVVQHALPQPKDLIIMNQGQKQTKLSHKREPNFSKIGDKVHEQRVRSEQARIHARPEAGLRSKAVHNTAAAAPQQVQDGRRPRNLLPAQMSLKGQRAKSLNPLIYPSWWGDVEQESPKKGRKAHHHSPDRQHRQTVAVMQEVAAPILTEQPRTRNMMYNADAYVNTCTTDQTIEHQQIPYNVHQDMHQNNNYPSGHPNAAQQAPGAHNHYGRPQGTFQMAAQRQQTETSMTQNSSTMSLADALQQAKATADRLQRDIDQSKRHRAQLIGNQGQAVNKHHFEDQQQPTVSANPDNPLIVDIRNEDHIRRHQALQAKQHRNSSRNSSNRELQSRKNNLRSARTLNQENLQRNGSRQQLQRYQGGSGPNVVLQHSPPRTTKTQQARQQYNSQVARQRAISQNKNTQSGPLPGYLKSVTSKIKDQIQQDRYIGQQQQNAQTQNAQVEIFVAPPPQQLQQQQQQQKVRSKRSHRDGQQYLPQQEGAAQQHQQQQSSKYGDPHGVKLKYQHSDMNQQYAQEAQAQHHQNQPPTAYHHHGQQYQQQDQHHYLNGGPQQQQQQQYGQARQQQYQQQQHYSVQDPAIIINQQQQASPRHQNQHPQQRHMGEVCQDLLDSPYIQKFAQADANNQNYNPHHHPQQQQNDNFVDSYSFDDTQNHQQQQNHNHQHHHYDQQQTSLTQDGDNDVSKQQHDDSTIQTHHLNAMSNGAAPLSQGGGNQPHLFSVENSSSMVMYNATVRNQGTNNKTDTSAANTQANDQNNYHLSHGNQILFDSKAFDGMPSQLHQINSQTGAPSVNAAPSSHNNLTTLNNQPFSVENPTISASSAGGQTDCGDLQHSQSRQTDQGHAFRSAGFGGGHLEQQPSQHANYQQPDGFQQQNLPPHPQQHHHQQQQQQQRPVSAYNRNGNELLRNQTGHDMQQMRQNQVQTPSYPNGGEASSGPYGGGAPDEQNFSKLIEKMDRMTSEETKIMTFKSQDNGYMPSSQGPDDHHHQFDHHAQQQPQQPTYLNNNQPHENGRFEPTKTNGTQYDKRGSLNTLSQMTNPFRTGIYNNPANGTTMMMSQSEMGQTRGQYNYGGAGGGPQQNNESRMLQDDQFSSPEDNKTMQQESNGVGILQHQNNNFRQEADHDPSSSSMSGYDMKGILSRVKNQANYVQNNVLKAANIESPIQPSDQYGDGPRHQYNASGFSQPHSDPNAHQFMSQNIPCGGDQTPFTAHALSHVVSQQNPVSERNTAGEAPSSYHPVVSQDFNPLKTTLGKEDDIPGNSSGRKSNSKNEESKRNPLQQQQYSNLPQRPPPTQDAGNTAALHNNYKLQSNQISAQSSSSHSHLPQFNINQSHKQQQQQFYQQQQHHQNQQHQLHQNLSELQATEIVAKTTPTHRSSSDHQTGTSAHNHQVSMSNKYMIANKKSSAGSGGHNDNEHDDDNDETTMTDDLSDYSSSAHDLAQSSRHQSQSNHHQQQQQMHQQLHPPQQQPLDQYSQNQSSNQRLMMMPKQLQPSSSQKQTASSQQPPMVQNFVQPPAQIHQDAAVDSQRNLESRMQDFINDQKALQAQSQPQLPNQNQSQMQQMEHHQQQQQVQTTPSVQMHFNPPQGQLKPMTDTEDTSSDDDDDDLSSGTGLSGTDTSGIDTSSMSQSMQSSVGVKGLINQSNQPVGVVDPGMISMPKQVKNQYPAMAFNHPKYAGTLQKHH